MDLPRATDRCGLVLGGGAALGAAHIGVLEVIEELGIDVEIVVGTSAGGLMAAAYAAGFTPAQMRERVTQASWADFGRLTLAPRLGLLDVSPLDAALQETFGDRLIEELPRIYGAVASDVRSRTPVLLHDGPLTTALSATLAVPGIFPPVRRDGMMLIDGAITSNVPVWAARQLGATNVIAVQLRATWNRSRIGQRIAEAAGVIITQGSPDVLVEPDTAGYSKWSPADIPDLIEQGRRAALKAFGAEG